MEASLLTGRGACAERWAVCANVIALLATIEHRLKMGHKVRMPLPVPYQGCRRVIASFLALIVSARRAGFGPRRLVDRKGRRVMTTLVALLAPSACEREYPLEPTFCDHWCHAFPTKCGQSPAACVQECEETKGPSGCASVRDELLACYEQLSDDKFRCVERVRIADGACQNERDALYECASPGIGQCLTTCRVLQQEVDPAVVATCPLASSSCEEVCWILEESGLDVGEAGVGVPAAPNDILLLQLGLLCRGDGGALPF